MVLLCKVRGKELCAGMDVSELQSAYEAAVKAYRHKVETMLALAQSDHEVEAFHAASVEVAALWERLCELRGLLSTRLEAPKSQL